MIVIIDEGSAIGWRQYAELASLSACANTRRLAVLFHTHRRIPARMK